MSCTNLLTRKQLWRKQPNNPKRKDHDFLYEEVRFLQRTSIVWTQKQRIHLHNSSLILHRNITVFHIEGQRNCYWRASHEIIIGADSPRPPQYFSTWTSVGHLRRFARRRTQFDKSNSKENGRIPAACESRPHPIQEGIRFSGLVDHIMVEGFRLFFF